MICVLATVKEPNCVQFFILIYNRVDYLLPVRSAMAHPCSDTERGYLHARARGRACAHVCGCRSMPVNACITSNTFNCLV